MTLASVDIVIVNWNGGDHLRACLRSVTAARHDGYQLRRVVVVDNGSSDGSAEGLWFPDIPLVLLRNVENLGFAAACNQGIHDSTADFVLLLNPDARILSDSLAKCIVFSSQIGNSNIGIIGPQLLDDNGSIARSCSRFPGMKSYFFKALGLSYVLPHIFPDHSMSEWDHKSSREVDHVIGACFLIRKQVLNNIGGFDERFFVYLEDLDFSLRAYRAGWKTYYLADAQAFHKGGGTSEQIKARRLYYSLESRIRYGYKHFGQVKGTIILLLTTLIELVPRMCLASLRFSVDEIGETLVGYLLLFRAIPTIIKSSVAVRVR